MTSEAVTPETRAAGRAKRKPLPVWVHFLIALALVAVLRNFVVQSFYVPSGSMIPTLEIGDRVVVSKLDNTFKRGDIVVFDGTDTFGGGTGERWEGGFGKVAAGLARVFGIHLGEKDYVKRIIGVGGDHLVVGEDGRLTINGKTVNEPYLAEGVMSSDYPFDVKVPAGKLFLMGDNREQSADSRAHLGDPGGGMIPESDVIGSPVLRYWPLGRFGTMGDSAHEPSLAELPAGSAS